MSKKVVILHGSPRVGGNSDILANEFMRGAEEAGHDVEKISFPMKFINYCKGCLGCQSSGECVIHDDMADILESMVNADVIVFATPIYFFTMSGQMKTIIDRTVPRYSEFKDTDIYLLFSAAETNEKYFVAAEREFNIFIDCLPSTTSKKGVVLGLGATDEGEIRNNAEAMEKAFNYGLKC